MARGYSCSASSYIIFKVNQSVRQIKYYRWAAGLSVPCILTILPCMNPPGMSINTGIDYKNKIFQIEV